MISSGVEIKQLLTYFKRNETEEQNHKQKKPSESRNKQTRKQTKVREFHPGKVITFVF